MGDILPVPQCLDFAHPFWNRKQYGGLLVTNNQTVLPTLEWYKVGWISAKFPLISFLLNISFWFPTFLPCELKNNAINWETLINSFCEQFKESFITVFTFSDCLTWIFLFPRPEQKLIQYFTRNKKNILKNKLETHKNHPSIHLLLWTWCKHLRLFSKIHLWYKRLLIKNNLSFSPDWHQILFYKHHIQSVQKVAERDLNSQSRLSSAGMLTYLLWRKLCIHACLFWQSSKLLWTGCTLNSATTEKESGLFGLVKQTGSISLYSALCYNTQLSATQCQYTQSGPSKRVVQALKLYEGQYCTFN